MTFGAYPKIGFMPEIFLKAKTCNINSLIVMRNKFGLVYLFKTIIDFP